MRLLLAAALLIVLVAQVVERGRRRGDAEAAFPELQGRLRVEGVGKPLAVLRDARGVPHVDGQSEADVFFGLGFVHAQDRLGQMQWLLRLAQGRSAEWVGEAGIEVDRWARTLDLVGLAEQELADADAQTRQMLEAYARGVNARIARIRAGSVAAPVVLRPAGVLRPLDDWRAVDSLAVLKAWVWALSGSVEASLALDDLLVRLGGEGARPFFPESPRGGGQGRAPGRVTAGVRGQAVEGFRDPLRRALGLAGSSAGSSAWVLGGAHTRSGRPLLAADAHIEPTTPPLLYLAHLRAPEFSISGATLPGVPAFWTGHNDSVAWASTHARAAVVELYTETLHPGGEPRYHDGRGWVRLEEREEAISVDGADDSVLQVRRTRHGPLLNGLLADTRDPLALAWVGQLGLGAQTLAALRDMARATDAEALLSAMRGVGEPPLAFVYADRAGAAGLQVAGWIPRRPLDTDLVPVPGRARWYDWDGRIPFELLPHARLEEGRGWLVAADNTLASGEGQDRGEWLWRGGGRAERIDAWLRDAVERGPVSLVEFTQLQSDVREFRARALIEASLRLAGPEDLEPEAAEVAQLLRSWSGESTPGSAGAAAYHVFLVALTEALFRERLGDPLFARYLEVPQADPGAVVARVVLETAESEGAAGWADASRVGDAVRESLRETWFHLSYRLGGSRAKWSWGRLHRVTFRPFVPGAPGAGASAFGIGGSGSTVNTQEYAPGAPFDVRLASAFRFAVDAAALDRSLAVLAPGQSEHPGHPHHTDGISAWLAGESSVLPTAGDLVQEAAVSRLLLEPAP